jgi:hypothetical protein
MRITKYSSIAHSAEPNLPQWPIEIATVAHSAEPNSPQWPIARKDLISQISRQIWIYIQKFFRSQMRGPVRYSLAKSLCTKNLMLLSLYGMNLSLSGFYLWKRTELKISCDCHSRYLQQLKIVHSEAVLAEKKEKRDGTMQL